MPARARPPVSLVAYVYDYVEYVGELLDSVFAQTFGDFELFFLDDGSTDGTGDVVRSYRDPRLRYVRQERAGRDRLDATFNRCVAETSGELIAVVNGDDRWHPRKLELQVPLLQRYPLLDVSFHDVEITDAAGNVRPGSFRPPVPDVVLHAGRLGPYQLHRNLIPNPTVVFRRSVVERIGPQQRGWMHDYDFWLRAAVARCRFHFLPDRLLRYRVHERSHSTSSLRAARIAAESRAMRLARRAEYTIEQLYPEIAQCRDVAFAHACAHVDLAVLLATGAEPLLELAEAELNAALRFVPGWPLAQHDLAVIELVLGRLDAGLARLASVATGGDSLASRNLELARAGERCALRLAALDPEQCELLQLRALPDPLVTSVATPSRPDARIDPRSLAISALLRSA